MHDVITAMEAREMLQMLNIAEARERVSTLVRIMWPHLAYARVDHDGDVWICWKGEHPHRTGWCSRFLDDTELVELATKLSTETA